VGRVRMLEARERVGEGGGGVPAELELAQGEGLLRLGVTSGRHSLRPRGLAPAPEDAHGHGHGSGGGQHRRPPAARDGAGSAVIARAKVLSPP
jgi:hypothetical protein